MFHIDDTSLLEDIQDVFRLSAKILKKEKLSFDSKANGEECKESESRAIQEIPGTSNDQEDNEEFEAVPLPKETSDKKRKKKKTEVERLKIDMKGWDFSTRINEQKLPSQFTVQAICNSAAPFIHNMSFRSRFKVSSDENMQVKVDRVCGHVGVEMEDVGGGGSVREVADNIFNDVVNDDSIFDDKFELFLI